MYKLLLLLTLFVQYGVEGCSWRPTAPTERPTRQPTDPESIVANWYPDTMAEPTQILWGGWSIDGPMMLFHQLETPVSVYHTMRWDFMSWHCVAAMSARFLDPLTNNDPFIRAETRHQTSYHRALCIVYARSFYMPVMTPTIVEEHENQMTAHGLNDEKLSQDEFAEVVSCLTSADPNSPVCQVFRVLERCLAWQKNECLRRIRTTIVDGFQGDNDRRAAAFAGAFVAASIFEDIKTDGYNAHGKMTVNGECTHEQLCVPFGDYTGYKAPNMPNVINSASEWAPLVEHNGEGFVYAQEHVTPHIGLVKGRSASPEQMARQVDFPADFNYTHEMEKVFERVANLDDTTIAMTLTMDNKLTIIIGIVNAFRSLANQNVSLEAQALFTAGYTNVEHDAVVACWREKVRHNRIRPTTYARHLMAEKKVKWYDGTDISSHQWTPLIRVMPHAEFPSGSSSICRGVADYSKRWFAEVIGMAPNATFPKTNWAASRGDAAKYGGSPDLPSEDIPFVMENLDHLAQVCGESRLWGGMHFTPAVAAGEELVQGFGDAAFEWTQSLLGGEPMPEPYVDPSRVGITVDTNIDLEHSERMHAQLCREDVDAVQAEIQQNIDEAQETIRSLNASLNAVLARNVLLERNLTATAGEKLVVDRELRECLTAEEQMTLA